MEKKNVHKNKEGYPDPTAGRAIDRADQPPETVGWYIKTIKTLADIMDLEIVGYIQIRDKKTKRIWQNRKGLDTP